MEVYQIGGSTLQIQQIYNIWDFFSTSVKCVVWIDTFDIIFVWSAALPVSRLGLYGLYLLFS